MILCSKLKTGLCKIVTKSQVVTKFNVTKSRLHCTAVIIISYVILTYTYKSTTTNLGHKVIEVMHGQPLNQSTLKLSKYASKLNNNCLHLP